MNLFLARKTLDQLGAAADVELDDAERALGRRLPHCRALARSARKTALGIEEEARECDRAQKAGDP